MTGLLLFSSTFLSIAALHVVILKPWGDIEQITVSEVLLTVFCGAVVVLLLLALAVL